MKKISIYISHNVIIQLRMVLNQKKLYHMLIVSSESESRFENTFGSNTLKMNMLHNDNRLIISFAFIYICNNSVVNCELWFFTLVHALSKPNELDDDEQIEDGTLFNWERILNYAFSQATFHSLVHETIFGWFQMKRAWHP